MRLTRIVACTAAIVGSCGNRSSVGAEFVAAI